MNIRTLKLFISLCETQHFGHTSRLMHTSPSTLSRQIQRLEHEVGVLLFFRDNRTVQLTKAGELFKAFSLQTVSHYEQLQHTLLNENQQNELTGELRLFCSVTAAYSHLPSILDRFRAKYPAIEIKLTTGDAADAIEKLQQNSVDLAITGYPDNLPQAIAFKQIDKIPMQLITPMAPSAFSDTLTHPKPDWASIPFILPEHGTSRHRVEQWFKQNKIVRPTIYATISGHEAIVPLVALGCGVAILPKIVVDNSPEALRKRILSHIIDIPALNLGICIQKKYSQKSVIHAFWSSIFAAQE